MGQVASTGASKIGKAPQGMLPISYPSLDGESALSKVPKQELVVVDYQVFDDPSFSDVNDGDGIVDSGETIELAVTIKNRWGKADPVTVTLAAQATGAVGPDPFVTWDIDTVDYGAVGNFGEDDNGVIRDPEGLVTGVENPFRFTVSKDAFNNHIIPIKVSISAGNGFDAEDPNAPYKFGELFDLTFDLVVQRGRVLPSIIEEDLVMTKDDYWIVDQPVLVPEGVTVTVTEGTQMQFWYIDSVDKKPNPFIKVEGTLNVIGTAEQPVELFPSEQLPLFWVRLFGSQPEAVSLKYFRIINPDIGERDVPIKSAQYGMVTQNGDELVKYYENRRDWVHPSLYASECYKIIYRNVGGGYFSDQFYPNEPSFPGFYFEIINPDTCLINNSSVYTEENLSLIHI